VFIIEEREGGDGKILVLRSVFFQISGCGVSKVGFRNDFYL
jgi:hypothetical protein